MAEITSRQRQYGLKPKPDIYPPGSSSCKGFEFCSDVDWVSRLLFNGHPGRSESFIAFEQTGDGGRPESLPDQFSKMLEPAGNGDFAHP